MDHEQLDLTGLTDDQKKAIECLQEKITNSKYFMSIWDYPPNMISEFRSVNEMKKSDDSEERTRGEKYELALLEACRKT